MTVESATYLEDLDDSNPAATDLVSEGDDHVRLLKTVLQNQFSSLGAAAVTKTAAEINDLAEQGTQNDFTSKQVFSGATAVEHRESGAATALNLTNDAGSTVRGRVAIPSGVDDLVMSTGSSPTERLRLRDSDGSVIADSGQFRTKQDGNCVLLSLYDSTGSTERMGIECDITTNDIVFTHEGTRVASLDSSGNLTLLGTVSESGSP